MSLFNALDYWSTRCGKDEAFGFESMIACDLLYTGADIIIVGSYCGSLRMYQISNNETEQFTFKATDLLLEVNLPSPVVQVVAGKLVSGSKILHIGVAFPLSIAVYSFSTIPGTTEHGNQFELKMIYEHPLQHTNYQLIVGSFGGVKNRDFLCSVALDGTLTFFEQETFVFQTQFPSFLLSSPVAYIDHCDLFVTVSSDWCVEGYRYQDLSNTASKKITATWSFNLGESVIGIQTAKDEKEIYVVILSEHNITCLGVSGNLKFTKRLQYTTLCFHIYINESNDKLMILTVSDVGTVYIYDQNTLLWCAKLSVVPVCILRAKLSIQGSLVLLSSQGELKCCYLGTTPSLFVAPPFENSLTTYKNLHSKWEMLQEEIRNLKKTYADSLSCVAAEKELFITSKMQLYDKLLNQYEIIIDVVPSRPISNLQVSFEAAVPICFLPDCHKLPNLYESTTLSSILQISDCKNIVPSSLETVINVCYLISNVPRVIRRQTSVPSRLVLLPCPFIEDTNFLKIQFEISAAPVPVLRIFPELKDDNDLENICKDDAAGFCLRYNADQKCFISFLKPKYGYEIAGNSISLMHLLLQQIECKLKNLKTGLAQSHEQFISNIKCLPEDNIQKAVRDHIKIRSERHHLLVSLEKLSIQFRLIQRRLLVKLKGKISSDISGLQMLYRDTYNKIIETIHIIEEKQNSLIINSTDLQSMLNLKITLLSMRTSISPEKLRFLRSALLLTDMNWETQEQCWEERTQAHLTYLLRIFLNGSENDQRKMSSIVDNAIKNSSQLENLIALGIDRVFGNQHFTSEKKIQSRAVSSIIEDDELEETYLRDGRTEFIKNEQLLSKRHIL